MSFIAGLCSTVYKNGLRLLGGCTLASPAARNFHTVMRPGIVEVRNSLLTMGAQVAFAPSSKPGGLLTPYNLFLTQVAGFKVKGRLKRRCRDCYHVVRQQRHYIICPTHGRHKQMSMKKRDYKSWVLTHATQSKVRPF